jgi:hypothetical protein
MRNEAGNVNDRMINPYIPNAQNSFINNRVVLTVDMVDGVITGECFFDLHGYRNDSYKFISIIGQSSLHKEQNIERFRIYFSLRDQKEIFCLVKKKTWTEYQTYPCKLIGRQTRNCKEMKDLLVNQFPNYFEYYDNKTLYVSSP